MSTHPPFTLDAKYTQLSGTILLSGVQAIIRVMLDQRRADAANGLNTAGFISGYRGSPLAGLDLLLARQSALLKSQHIVFKPGVNEDLAATMIWGSQIANLLPLPKYDGVIGLWYGKAPGLDRSLDIFKHANVGGTGKLGGVLAVVGDDAMSKSSTLPSRSDTALYDALLPVLAPGNVQDVLDFGRLGYELSRYTGLWAGFKIETHVADQFATAEVDPNRLHISLPEFEYKGKPWAHTRATSQTHTLGSPTSIMLEQEIHEGRLVAAVKFAAANGLNRVRVDGANARVGIIAAGKVYYEVRQALLNLGLDDEALRQGGVRLLQIGMVYPLDAELVRQFARGLDEILVVEDKRAFLELLLRDALYSLPQRPRIIGKKDANDQTLIPYHGGLDAALLQGILARWAMDWGLGIKDEGLSNSQSLILNPQSIIPLSAPRQAYFCSGCPHNRSTIVPADSLALGGIGCHGLVHSMGRNTIGLGHMGGEGAQWAGAQSFSDTPHMFQNLGDGTFFHSGSLAIRQAVAAGSNITYKLLYNDAVGMTGGQAVDGIIPVPALTHLLHAEGAKRIIITTNDVEKYDELKDDDANALAIGVEVWHRDRLDEAQRALREVNGVTVLIHDQMCAAELRRRRKRGKAIEPTTRVYINEAVCEGCGDCGVKSNCLSVHPVETEFGRKTQIHQSSCNKDYSCLLGNCPAFITVEDIKDEGERVKDEHKPRPFELSSSFIPHPSSLPTAANLFLMGIGGTGVVTASQILATAALLDGKCVDGMDQTGLSQKGGAVVSHIRISTSPNRGSNLLSIGEADVYLAFDVLTATQPQNLARARAGHTVAIGSISHVPTGGMVRNVDAQFPNNDILTHVINQYTCPNDNYFFDAEALAEQHFGDHLASNLIVIGVAFQRGLIPISADAIERAITLNGAQVEMNLAAFRLGRMESQEPRTKNQEPRIQNTDTASSTKHSALSTQHSGLTLRVQELTSYQNTAYAAQYVEFVARVKAAEVAAMPGQTRLSEAVTRYLFKLMAYKDEYEVARLHLKPEARAALQAQFGADAAVTYHLHPPIFKMLGLKQKIKLGRWFDSVYRVLVGLRGLRGTPFDPFGYDAVRKLERTLIGEYRGLIEHELAQLGPANYERAVKLAELPDLIRGYDEVKLANVARFRAQVQALVG
ncbi:MAG: indolepyruvate ferredoxin oxidoreductase family protein [Chloroflexi bacterium]|nr:indolepyruvate ferredoxin oxidoreductase family protein [Chloroflexota bacterium]